MAEHLLEMKDTAAAPNVVRGEAVTERMQCSCWRIKAELLTQALDASERGHAANLDAYLGRKEQRVRSEKVRNEVVQSFTQSKREGNYPLLPALAVEHEEHVV